MDFTFTKEEEAFRQEFREFINNEISPQQMEACWENGGFIDTFTEGGEPIIREIAQKLAKKGWLTMWWPREYGGQEASNMKRLIYYDETGYYRLPLLSVDMGVGGISWIAPVLMLYGSEEQKREHLPKIAAGERIWCSGYSEPDAGSDLSALRCRAVADGDFYIVNGQKIWITAAHFADWCWLAVRTDPNSRKSNGISILLVDMKTPGITVRPIVFMQGHHSFNQVFFENVRVPKANRVGEENQGWRYIRIALDFERSVNIIKIASSVRRAIDELVRYTKEARRGDELLANNPLVRHKLAEMAIEAEIGRLLVYRAAWMQGKGLISDYEAAMIKVYITELIKRLANVAMQILGLYSQLTPGSWRAPLSGLVEYTYLTSFAPSIGAGPNEIQKDIIAIRGLGLPRISSKVSS